MSSNLDQAINWAGNWEVAAGCVERYFHLHPVVKGDSNSYPRYRVQMHGFLGGFGELYETLQTVSLALASDSEGVLQGIAKDGRAIVTIKMADLARLAGCVIVVERDPRDFVRFGGQVG